VRVMRGAAPPLEDAARAADGLAGWGRCGIVVLPEVELVALRVTAGGEPAPVGHRPRVVGLAAQFLGQRGASVDGTGSPTKTSSTRQHMRWQSKTKMATRGPRSGRRGVPICWKSSP
jgi:hypothetical protein